MLSENYRASAEQALRLAHTYNWPLTHNNTCFTLSALLSYLKYQERRVISGAIKYSTLLSYLTGIKAYHISIYVDWSPVYKHFLVTRKLHEM